MAPDDRTIQLWEQQAAQADQVETMLATNGWKIITEYLKDMYEQKILDTFRRIPGDARLDAGFRILQGQYQMLQHVMHAPREVIELGEQARRHLGDICEQAKTGA